MNAGSQIEVAGLGTDRITIDPVPFQDDSSRTPSPGRSRRFRVVTLGSLSPMIPDDLIGSILAEFAQSETRDSVVLVRIEGRGAPVSLPDFRMIRAGSGADLEAHLKEGPGGTKRLDVRAGADDGVLLRPVVEQLGGRFALVVLQLDVDVPGQVLFECLARSESGYLLVRQSQENLYDIDLLLRGLRSRLNGDFSRLKAVLCLMEGERARSLSELSVKVGGSIHGYIHDCPSFAAQGDGRARAGTVFRADIRRLAREIGRCRVGLALSSGGAKGLAHIGVIQVLEENGIEVDVVAGCSMGAYIGAVWGFGCDGREMEKLGREVEGRLGVWRLVDPVLPPREGFIRGRAVKRRLQRTIGDAHFSELPRPVRVVATNLYTLERVVFSAGEVASAVHASVAIPGVCAPVVMDGETYVDGGVADPLPVDVLQEMGIHRIIAVNTIPTTAYMRCCLEREREQEEIYGRRHAFLKALNRQVNYFAPGNVLDIMMRAVQGPQIRVAEEACRRADVVLRPLAMDGSWYEFDKPTKFIALGRRAAEERLEEIRALVNKPAVSYEPESVVNAVAGLA